MAAPFLSPGTFWRHDRLTLMRGISDLAGGREVQEWECPCRCGAFALYVRAPGRLIADQVATGKVRRRGKPVPADYVPVHVLWIVLSDSLSVDEVAALGIESVSEIATQEDVVANAPTWSADNCMLLTAYMMLGLGEHLERALAAPAA